MTYEVARVNSGGQAADTEGSLCGGDRRWAATARGDGAGCVADIESGWEEDEGGRCRACRACVCVGCVLSTRLRCLEEVGCVWGGVRGGDVAAKTLSALVLYGQVMEIKLTFQIDTPRISARGARALWCAAMWGGRWTTTRKRKANIVDVFVKFKLRRRRPNAARAASDDAETLS